MNTPVCRIAVLSLLIACAPPTLLPDLQRAETLEHAGKYNAALNAYTASIRACTTINDPDKRNDVCGQARLGHAELLDRVGQRSLAATAYVAIAKAPYRRDDHAGTGLYRAGRIHLALGHDIRAYKLLWQSMVHHPNATAAELALHLVFIDGRRRNARQLYRAFKTLYLALRDTELADNLLYDMAQLAEIELDDPHRALIHYDAIVAYHPKHEFFDDSLWHGARLARAMANPTAAAERYRKLLDSREVAWFTGSYNSKWHDDAQFQLAIVYRDDFRRYSAALTAFRTLENDFPHSTLLDDATYERALTYERMQRQQAACAALAELRQRWPDSRYELDKAPAMRQRLNCDPASATVATERMMSRTDTRQ